MRGFVYTFEYPEAEPQICPGTFEMDIVWNRRRAVLGRRGHVRALVEAAELVRRG